MRRPPLFSTPIPLSDTFQQYATFTTLRVIRKIINHNLDPFPGVGSRSAADLNILLCCSRLNSYWRTVAEDVLFLHVHINERTLFLFHRVVLQPYRPRNTPVRTRTLVVFGVWFDSQIWKLFEAIFEALSQGDVMLRVSFQDCRGSKVDRLLTIPGNLSQLLLPRAVRRLTGFFVY